MGAVKDAPRELEMRWMRQVVAFCAASDWKSRQMRRGAVRDLSQRECVAMWRRTDIVTGTRLDWPNGHTWPIYSKLHRQHPHRWSFNYSINYSIMVIIHSCHQEGLHRTSSCKRPGDKTGGSNTKGWSVRSSSSFAKLDTIWVYWDSTKSISHKLQRSHD